MGVWEIQRTVASSLPQPAISPESARAGLAQGKPIFGVAAPAVDMSAYLEACAKIAAYVADTGVLPQAQGEGLRAFDFSPAFTQGLAEAAHAPEAWVSRTAAVVARESSGAVSHPTAAFVLHSALVPFLAPAAAAVLESVGPIGAESHALGSCPVCGSAAAMGRVGERTHTQGAQRVLWCEWCHAEWAYDRIRCARCGTRDAEKLRYTHVEPDEARRVHLCDDCQGYLRVVFEDEVEGAVSMLVESVLSAHLDALALELGYTATGNGGARSS